MSRMRRRGRGLNCSISCNAYDMSIRWMRMVLLAKIRKSIPDASAAEVARWADKSKARYRMIDGQKLFFRREPQNIFLFSSEAKARRNKADKGKKSQPGG